MDLLDELYQPKLASLKTKKGKKKTLVDNPVLFKTGDVIDYTFILDSYPEPYKLSQIKKYINTNKIVDNYQIIYPLKIKAKKKDFKEGKTIVKFLKANLFDLSELIPEWSKVFTFGRMLYAVNESSQMNLEGFYDTLMMRTNYFLPSLKCQIFPVETYGRSIFTDSFESYFLDLQFLLARELEVKKRRIPSKNCIHIKDTTSFFQRFLGRQLMALDIETAGFEWLTDEIGSIQFSFDSETGYFLNWSDINIDELNEFLKGKKVIAHNGKFDGKFCIQNGIIRENFILYADTLNMGHVINELRLNNLKGLTGLYTDYFGYDKELDEFKEQYPDISYIDMPFDLRLKYGATDPCVTFEIFESMLEEIRGLDKQFPLDNGNSLESYFFNEIMPVVNEHLDSEMVGVDINVEELYRNSIYFHKVISDLKANIRTALHLKDESVNLSSGKQLSEVLKGLGWPDMGLNKDGSYTLNDESLKKYVDNGYKEADLILKLHSLETIMNTFVGYPIFKGSEVEFNIFDAIEDDEDLENSTQAFNGYNFPDKLEMSNIVLGKGTGYWQYLKKVGRGKYKVYPNFATCLASSHRNKHRKPNLANIPARGIYAKRIRRIYTPPSKDHVWVSADQAGLQLRNIAFLLEEGSPMRTAFIELGGDIHSMTGAKVINNNRISVEEFMRLKKTDKEIGLKRYKAKGMNFGVAFNAQEYTVRTTVIEPNWSDEECEEFIIEEGLDIVKGDIYLTVAREMRKRHLDTYYGLDKYNKKTIREAKKDGFVRSPYGSFRRLPYLLVKIGSDGDSLDKKRYANFESISLNSRIQTLETVAMNRTFVKGMRKVRELDLRASLPDMIHDAGEFFCHREDLTKFCTLIKYFAEIIYPEYKGIPLEMEGNVADYWKTYRTVGIDKDGKEKDTWEVWDFGPDWNQYIDESYLEKLKGAS